MDWRQDEADRCVGRFLKKRTGSTRKPYNLGGRTVHWTPLSSRVPWLPGYSRVMLLATGQKIYGRLRSRLDNPLLKDSRPSFRNRGEEPLPYPKRTLANAKATFEIASWQLVSFGHRRRSIFEGCSQWRTVRCELVAPTSGAPSA